MNSNEYMAKYMKERYHRRRGEWLEKLGSKCVKCGSKENLEFDHIDPEQKEIDVHRVFSGWSDERIPEELDKCQLLCQDCHTAKTRKNGEHGKNQVVHGSYWMYRKYGCRCDPCIEAFRKKDREYKKRYREKKNNKGV